MDARYGDIRLILCQDKPVACYGKTDPCASLLLEQQPPNPVRWHSAVFSEQKRGGKTQKNTAVKRWIQVEREDLVRTLPSRCSCLLAVRVSGTVISHSRRKAESHVRPCIRVEEASASNMWLEAICLRVRSCWMHDAWRKHLTTCVLSYLV